MRKLSLIALFTAFFSAVAHAQQTVWWGFWTTPNMPWQELIEPADGRHNYAIRLMPADTLLSDTQLHGLRFLISDKTAVKRAWIWVSVKMPNWSTALPDMAVRELSTDELSDIVHAPTDAEAYTTVDFAEPVGIMPSTNKRANCYVGFTLELEGTATSPCHIVSAGPGELPGDQSCFIDGGAYHSRYGQLALQLRLSGGHIGEHSATVEPFERVLTTAGQHYYLQTNIANRGTQPITDIDYVVTLNGVDGQEEHAAFPFNIIDELDEKMPVPFTVRLPAEARYYDCRLTVTQVNGHPNECAAKSAQGSIYALSQMPLKRTVMEELTGTWCPNCPRGMVGLRVLDELFGDRFVGIAVHGGDAAEPMRLPNYDGSSVVRGISQRMGGRPSCSVDRTIDCDPYGGLGNYWEFGADFVVSNMLQQPTVADIDIAASWTDESMTTIDCDVATTFRFGAAQTDCALMLVLTADSLAGEGRDWQQVNTLAGKTEYEDYCDEFVYGDYRMNIKYNHVPIWADGVEQGIEGSIALPLQADVTQHYRRTVALQDSPIADVLTPLSLQHLHAVALLLDNATGQVVNVAKTSVEGGTNALPHSATPLLYIEGRRYLPDGRPTGASHRRGLVIERRTDGSVRKSVH